MKIFEAKKYFDLRQKLFSNSSVQLKTSKMADKRKMLMVDHNLLPNDTAPDFILDSVVNGNVEKFCLSSLKGKSILLYFYPVDFGYVSPTEFYQLETLLEKFQLADCEVVAISTEHTPSMIKFQKAPQEIAGLGGNMKLRLVSDPNGDVSKSYGVFKIEENVSFKAIVLIDKDFRITSCEKYDFPIGCNFEEILKKVQESVGQEGKRVPGCSTCEITGFVHGCQK